MCKKMPDNKGARNESNESRDTRKRLNRTSMDVVKAVLLHEKERMGSLNAREIVSAWSIMALS